MSRRRLVSDKDELFRLEEEEEEEEVGVKEMSLGIIFPPRAVTRMMADLVPLGPVTLTRPVGKVFIVVLPEIMMLDEVTVRTRINILCIIGFYKLDSPFHHYLSYPRRTNGRTDRWMDICSYQYLIESALSQQGWL